jgi:hypothetical protein
MPETVTPVPLPSWIAATDISVVATDPPITAGALFYAPFSTVSANSNHVFSVHNWAGPPILKIAVLVLVLLLLYWVFGRFISVIQWALDRIAYALGVILFGANRYAAAARSGQRLQFETVDGGAASFLLPSSGKPCGTRR